MKIVGLSLLFFCVTLSGIYSSHKTKESIKQLHAILSLMQYIKSQIEYFNDPLFNIYNSFETENAAFSDFVKDVSKNGWNKALKKTDNLLLTDKTAEIIHNFGKSLGKTNKEDQIRHCEYYISLMEAEYEEIEKRAPEKAKLTVTLSFYAGLLLLIIFW